jgi:hypothetical protein
MQQCLHQHYEDQFELLRRTGIPAIHRAPTLKAPASTRMFSWMWLGRSCLSRAVEAALGINAYGQETLGPLSEVPPAREAWGEASSVVLGRFR